MSQIPLSLNLKIYPIVYDNVKHSGKPKAKAGGKKCPEAC